MISQKTKVEYQNDRKAQRARDRMKSERRCLICETKLNSYNEGRHCYRCDTKLAREKLNILDY